MAILPMRRYGDPILRQKAKPVDAVTPELRKLIADMIDTMHDEIGVGLAAPQVGVSLRLAVMDDGKGGTRALINPRITEWRGSVLAEEGCLSVPRIFADLTRAEWIRMEAEDEEGGTIAQELHGFPARIVQHEIDHLDGVLFIDHLPPVARDRIRKKIHKEGFGPKDSHREFAL
jgi:peptide deformylase